MTISANPRIVTLITDALFVVNLGLSLTAIILAALNNSAQEEKSEFLAKYPQYVKSIIFIQHCVL